MTEQERHIQLRQIITSQGESILEQKKLVNTLMDLGYFVDYGEVRKVFSTIIEEGYSQTILSYAHGSDKKDSVFPYIIDGLQTKYCYDVKTISYTLQCILYGLGVIESVEPFNIVKDLEWLNRLNSNQDDAFDDWNAEYVIMNVSPSDAEIYIDYKLYKPTSGTAVVELGYGMHSYRVCAPMHHSSVGDINVVEGKQETINVSLDPSYGSLEVHCNAEDGVVFVDGQDYGKAPINLEKIGSGRHTLEIKSQFYKNYVEDILVKDKDKLSVNATLEPNFGEVYIVCQNSKTSIYIDNEYVGDGTWNGKLIVGSHALKCMLDSHYSYTEDIYVNVSSKTGMYEIHKIPELQPYYGGVKINVLPVGCIVNIDGEDVGVTPYRNKSMLVGKHSIKITNPESDKYNEYFVQIEQSKIYEIVDTVSGQFEQNLSLIKVGNYLYEDATFSSKLMTTKKCIGIVFSLCPSYSEQKSGWSHGYIISMLDKSIKDVMFNRIQYKLTNPCPSTNNFTSKWRIPSVSEWRLVFSNLLGVKNLEWEHIFSTDCYNNKNDIIKQFDDDIYWTSGKLPSGKIRCVRLLINFVKGFSNTLRLEQSPNEYRSVRFIAAF